MTDEFLVFVYGSLLRGLSNEKVLAEAEFLAPGVTTAAYRLVDLGPYPGMVHGGATAVRGEIYRAPARLLGALDELEDHPHVYIRTSISLSDGREVLAYLLRAHLAEGRPEVASGDWRAYLAQRARDAHPDRLQPQKIRR